MAPAATKMEPKGTQRDQNGAKRAPKSTQSDPNGAKWEPKGDQNASKKSMLGKGRKKVRSGIVIWVPFWEQKSPGA